MLDSYFTIPKHPDIEAEHKVLALLKPFTKMFICNGRQAILQH